MKFIICLKCKNKNIEGIRKIFHDKFNKIQPQFRNFKYDDILKYCISMSDMSMYKSTSIFIKNILNTYKNEKEILDDKNTTSSCNIM